MEPRDLDVGGVVGIRCLGATPGELLRLARQVGGRRSVLRREPDISVRFVDRLPPEPRLRLLGVDDVAFSDDDFFVLRGPGKSRVRVKVPLDRLGGRCEFVCQRGLSAVPLLSEAIHLTALSRRVVPLHASAFNHEGVGVLVTGWSDGGKTATLLAFMSRGAGFVGDDRVLIDEGGTRMSGSAQPLCVRAWHLEHLPITRARLSRRRRLALRLWRAAESGARRAVASRRLGAGPTGRLAARLLPALRTRQQVEWTPEALFGPSRLALSGAPQRVLLVLSHERPEVVVRRISAEEVAERALASLEYERGELMACYRKFRFAFPQRSNPLIERAGAIERTLLTKALEGKPAWAVQHPHPVALPELYRAVRPLLSRRLPTPGGSSR